MNLYEPKPTYGLLVVACSPEDVDTGSRHRAAPTWGRLLSLLSQLAHRLGARRIRPEMDAPAAKRRRFH